MRVPKSHKNPGTYVAFLRSKNEVYPQSFEFPGDKHESAWGFAERTSLFKDIIVLVVPAYKFGNKMQNLLEKQAVNRGCITR